MVVSDVEMIKQILVKDFAKFNVRKVRTCALILWEFF